jgi:hypothetical protein
VSDLKIENKTINYLVRYWKQGKNEILDEAYSDNVKSFHLEYMDEETVWMRLSFHDGRSLDINLWSKKRIHGRVEEDA